MSEPLADRPHMPGYGIREDTEGILPWSWAEERLAASRNYWIATTRPDSRPHVMAVWGLWLDGRFWFSTAITSVKAHNLARNPACAITVENGSQAVVLEGSAQLVKDEDALRPVWEAYKTKYNWPMEGEKMFAVRPLRAFAFTESDNFAGTATRWTFE